MKESEISAGSKNHRLIKLLFFGGKLNYICGKVDDESDGGNKCDVYIDYDDYPFVAGIIFLILAHPVYKMWIMQEPNKLALWNKLHFEEKKTESIERV